VAAVSGLCGSCCARRTGLRPGVELARARAGATAVLVRVGSVRRGAAPRHRHRRAGGSACARTRRRDGLFRGRGSDRWQDRDDPDTGRLRRHARAPRVVRGQARGRRGGGRSCRLRRPERRPGARGAVHVPRHPADGRRAGVPRPAALPTTARSRSGRTARDERTCAARGAGSGRGASGSGRGWGAGRPRHSGAEGGAIARGGGGFRSGRARGAALRAERGRRGAAVDGTGVWRAPEEDHRQRGGALGEDRCPLCRRRERGLGSYAERRGFDGRCACPQPVAGSGSGHRAPAARRG
jgi:hypothetical protein